MNRPARFTELDLVRAGKAATKLGPQWVVEILPDGTISLVRRQPAPVTAIEPVEHPQRVRLC